MPAEATQGRLSALFDALMKFRSSSPTAEAWGQLEVYLVVDDYSDRFGVDKYTFSPHTVLEAKTRHRKPDFSEARSSSSYTIQRKGKRMLGYVEEEKRLMYGSEVRRMIETIRSPQVLLY